MSLLAAFLLIGCAGRDGNETVTGRIEEPVSVASPTVDVSPSPLTETTPPVPPTLTSLPALQPTSTPTAAPNQEPTEAAPFPTATIVATPTQVPEPTADVDLMAALMAEFDLTLTDPLPESSCFKEREATTITLRCAEPAQLLAPAPARVVFLTREQPGGAVFSPVPVHDENVSWSLPSTGAPIVVLDHGPVGSYSSVMSVFTNVVDMNPTLTLGAAVKEASELGRVADGTGWTVLIEDRPFGVAASGAAAELSVEDALAVADLLSERIVTPVDPTCPLNLNSTGEIPNADRSYRNGTHRGIDFICAQRDQTAFAAMEGTVITSVRDYADANPGDRSQLLANAGAAGFTPRWTLNALFGNYVIIEHEPVDGLEVASIYAHLESVDVEAGDQVVAGQPLGEIGNRGTAASAAGTTQSDLRSIHLHWEIFVGGAYFGSGFSVSDTIDLYTSLLCSSAGSPTPGCTF